MKKLIFILIGLVLLCAGCENEGVVDIHDCREVINVMSGDLYSYTCNFDKDSKGRIVGKFCARVKLSDNAECTKAYWYASGTLSPNYKSQTSIDHSDPLNLFNDKVPDYGAKYDF